MKYDFNLLETAARGFVASGDFAKAIRVYLFMSDGDPSLDGGYLGEQLGKCCEALGDLTAAKYWYGRAVEENPEVRTFSIEARRRLEHVTIDDIVSGYIIS